DHPLAFLVPLGDALLRVDGPMRSGWRRSARASATDRQAFRAVVGVNNSPVIDHMSPRDGYEGSWGEAPDPAAVYTIGAGGGHEATVRGPSHRRGAGRRDRGPRSLGGARRSDGGDPAAGLAAAPRLVFPGPGAPTAALPRLRPPLFSFRGAPAPPPPPLPPLPPPLRRADRVPVREGAGRVSRGHPGA